MYIIVYIIRLLLKYNDKKIKSFIMSWYIFKLRIIKIRVIVIKGWQPLQ